MDKSMNAVVENQENVDVLHDSIERDMFRFVNKHAESMNKVREDTEVYRENRYLRNKINQYENRRNSTMTIAFNIAKNVIVAICVIYMLWVLVSWANVVIYRMDANAADKIWAWNFFKVFIP